MVKKGQNHGLEGLQDDTKGKGYKRTEVGVIPDDWEVTLLDSVAKRGSGHTPDKKHPEYWDGNIKWISLKDSDSLDDLYIYDTAEKITPLGIANSSAVIHPMGTVVLSRDAGVGKSAITKDVMAVSQHFMAWRCSPQLETHFLYYWLQSNKSEFERIAIGSTIKTIGLPYFKKLKIPLPPPPEQKAIALCLSDTDALIAACDRAITKKRNIKQGAMQQLLTGKKRLPGFSGEWEVKTFGDISFVNQGLQIAIEKRLKNPLPTSKKYITIQFMNNGKDIEYINDYSSSVCCNQEDVLMTRTGNTGIVVSGVSGVFHNNFFKINFDRKVLDNNYLIGYLKLDKTQKLILTKAGTSTIPDLNHNDFYSLPIPLPPILEQKAITQILSDMDAEIAALEKKRDKYKAIKQGMMQELLTGKTRLVDR